MATMLSILKRNGVRESDEGPCLTGLKPLCYRTNLVV